MNSGDKPARVVISSEKGRSVSSIEDVLDLRWFEGIVLWQLYRQTEDAAFVGALGRSINGCFPDEDVVGFWLSVKRIKLERTAPQPDKQK